jgi:hypothetical protein
MASIWQVVFGLLEPENGQTFNRIGFTGIFFLTDKHSPTLVFLHCLKAKTISR